MDEAFSYSIDPATGMLTQVSVVSTKGLPSGFSVDAQGKFVYVAEAYNSELRIAVLQIGPASTLTFVRAFNFSEMPIPVSLTL